MKKVGKSIFIAKKVRVVYLVFVALLSVMYIFLDRGNTALAGAPSYTQQQDYESCLETYSQYSEDIDKNSKYHFRYKASETSGGKEYDLEFSWANKNSGVSFGCALRAAVTNNGQAGMLWVSWNSGTQKVTSEPLDIKKNDGKYGKISLYVSGSVIGGSYGANPVSIVGGEGDNKFIDYYSNNSFGRKTACEYKSKNDSSSPLGCGISSKELKNVLDVDKFIENAAKSETNEYIEYKAAIYIQRQSAAQEGSWGWDTQDIVLRIKKPQTSGKRIRFESNVNNFNIATWQSGVDNEKGRYQALIDSDGNRKCELKGEKKYNYERSCDTGEVSVGVGREGLIAFSHRVYSLDSRVTVNWEIDRTVEIIEDNSETKNGKIDDDKFKDYFDIVIDEELTGLKKFCKEDDNKETCKKGYEEKVAEYGTTTYCNKYGECNYEYEEYSGYYKYEGGYLYGINQIKNYCGDKNNHCMELYYSDNSYNSTVSGKSTMASEPRSDGTSLYRPVRGTGEGNDKYTDARPLILYDYSYRSVPKITFKKAGKYKFCESIEAEGAESLKVCAKFNVESDNVGTKVNEPFAGESTKINIAAEIKGVNVISKTLNIYIEDSGLSASEDLGSKFEKTGPGGREYNVFDVRAGNKYCAEAIVKYYGGLKSRSHCESVGKKPSLQVWGAGMFTNGAIAANNAEKRVIDGKYSYVPKGGEGNTTVFGTWVEQHIAANGNINIASGAATGRRNGELGGSKEGTELNICIRSPLTMPNAGCGTVSSPNPGGSSGSMEKPNDKEKLIKELNDNSCNKVASSIGGIKVSRGQSLFYCYSGNLNIRGNIEYEDGYNAISEIPKVVIYSKRDIFIACNVTRIDAVLIADGVVNTCNNSDVNSRDRSNQLKINGAIIANKMLANRTYGASTGVNSGTPAEIINYNSLLYLQSASEADVTKTGKLKVVYQTELAPRL